MAVYNRVSQKLICLALITFMPTLCSTFTLSERVSSLSKNGFQYIGSIREDATVGVSSAGTKARSLWLSPPNARETQVAAISKCRDLGGQLLFILTAGQYQDVEIMMLPLGEPVWTSAIYDVAQDSFAWFVNKAPVDRGFLRGEQRCSQANPGMGLVVQGFMSGYGLCSTRMDTSLRYICSL